MHQISEDASDELVEVFFLALPAMDSEEMATLLGYVINIVEREIRRAKHEARHEERRRWSRPSMQ